MIIFENKLLKKIKSFKKRRYLKKKFFLLKNTTILSNNCLAYFIYKDINCKYLSPTIGVQIPISDFINFFKNFRSLIELKLIEGNPNDFRQDFKKVGGKEINFPCAFLGNIKIMFQHEQTFEEADEKWRRRILRVQNNPILIIWVNSFELTRQLIDSINDIKTRKIVLTDSKSMEVFNDWYYVEIPIDKEWWQQDEHGIRYFERLNWNKILKERI